MPQGFLQDKTCKCNLHILFCLNKAKKHCTLDACRVRAMCVCVCVFTVQCRIYAAALLYSIVLLFTRSHYKTVFDLTHNISPHCPLGHPCCVSVLTEKLFPYL